MRCDLYAGLLRVMDDFACGEGVPAPFAPPRDADALIARYDLGAVAGAGGDWDRAANINRWLAAHVRHKGGNVPREPVRALDWLDYALDQSDRGLSCFALSETLAQCLRALGIAARALYLRPFSPYDGDSHAACEIWTRETGTWAMLDPAFGGYLTDEAGAPLDALSLRRRVAYREPVRFSEGFAHNGDAAPDRSEIYAYYAKNLFYLQTAGTRGLITLAPRGFDAAKREAANAEYRARVYGEVCPCAPVVYVSARSLYAPPA